MAFAALIPPVYTNVLQYGAVGNGTTDDTTAITAALAAIPTATGGVLYFPPNHTYIVSTGIDISAYSGNLWLLGGGWSSVLKLATNANTYLIKNTSGAQQGTRISNLKLDCNGTNQTGVSGGIYGYKYRRCLIDYCWIHNPYETGIELIGDPGDFGYQNDIVSCFIEGGQNCNGKGRGIYLVNTDENYIAANLLQSNGGADTSLGDNCHIRDDNGLSTYVGNKIVNGLMAFKLNGLQNRIIGNAFDGNGAACVQINGSAAETIFAHNTAINVGYLATGGSANSINGIYLNATRCIIKDNYWESDGSATPKTHSFVNIDAGGTYSLVEGNTLNVKTGSGTVVPISFVSGLPTGCRVRNNVGFNTVASAVAFLTENYGSASITTGNTSVVVTHGLAITPTLNQIQVTANSAFGSAAKFWISTPTSTTFTINVDANPAATVTFGWSAQVGY